MKKKSSITGPISAQVNTVFIHVTDLKKAAQWYSDLFGLEINLEDVHSPVYNIPVKGDTGITLDDHAFDASFQHSPSKNPCFNFFTLNIEEAYTFVKNKGIKITREIEKVNDNTIWFNIEDIDGNQIMICNC
ncbi:VOC family protein [Rossellomorea sp. BNER]|uniref:VOC family protein n=1 Tax=Rossellomorea sp. BNER TaxID=2962031 RepID=UPI003AF2DB5B|nr:VOC family protein [Rossellomorea sp. BNER]